MNLLNIKVEKILKNINYTVSANFLVLSISVLLNLFVPKFIGVKQYSYWQLYVFYSSYVGFFHLGWLDGIYLKNGGKEYTDLDHPSLGSQFWYLFLFELLLSGAIVVNVLIFSHSPIKRSVLLLTAVVSIVRNLNSFILCIFQSTNRIKEYAKLSRNDRYIYIVLLVMYLLLGGNDFFILILLDIISRVINLIWGLFRVKDLILRKLLDLKLVLYEIIDNIRIGSNLMLGNIAAMLIIGVSRLLVEYKWSVETFGKLSLTLSISNMLMTFINAVGVVMFPMLRRTNPKNLSNLYINIRNLFVPCTFLVLIFFQPIKIFLEVWLPSYKQSLLFMGILFPMVIYEGRMSLLVTTFLKTIRQEKTILVSNVIALIFSVVFSIIATIFLNNLFLTVGIIMISICLRCIIAESLLSKILDLHLSGSLYTELFLTILFVSSNLLFNTLKSFLVYLAFFGVYLACNRKKLHSSIRFLILSIRAE